jgi:hypothetical protein
MRRSGMSPSAAGLASSWSRWLTPRSTRSAMRRPLARSGAMGDPTAGRCSRAFRTPSSFALPDAVEIIAIAHAKRHPGYWAGRVEP